MSDFTHRVLKVDWFDMDYGKSRGDYDASMKHEDYHELMHGTVLVESRPEEWTTT